MLGTRLFYLLSIIVNDKSSYFLRLKKINYLIVFFLTGFILLSKIMKITNKKVTHLQINNLMTLGTNQNRHKIQVKHLIHLLLVH